MPSSQVALCYNLWCHNRIWKYIFPPLYVRAKMIVHAFMIELDHLDYWYPRKIKNFVNICTKSMENCSLVESQILVEFHPARATKLCIISSLKWIIQICSKFTVGFLKIAFYSPNPHCCLGKHPLETFKGMFKVSIAKHTARDTRRVLHQQKTFFTFVSWVLSSRTYPLWPVTTWSLDWNITITLD